jgi:hypothetical protein
MKHLNFLLFLFISLNLFAQTPGAFSYQAVVRNSSGDVVANQNVSFRISILQDTESGPLVYVEEHATMTNDFGLANLEIGNGTAISGTFSPTGWGDTPHFIKVEFDPDGGSAFTELGTSQMLSVPYAFHAETATDVDDADADPSNEIQSLAISGTELTLSDGGGTVTLPSSGVGDNWGTQTVESDATLTGEGTTASPLSVDGDLTDDQTLSISGSDLSISEGNTVTLPSAGTSLWTEDGDDIYFNGGKVGIGAVPGNDLKKFQVVGGQEIGIHARNEDDTYGALFAENLGSGPAADFRNHIRILDGTEGDGKVLTSDADGYTSWQTPSSGSSLWLENGTEIYYEDNVGIGISDPEQDLDIVNPTSSVRIKSTTSGTLYDGDAFLVIDKASNSKNANLNLQANGTTQFYAGLLGNNNFRISSDLENLNGLEVKLNGNVNISGELQTEATGDANMAPIAYGTVKSGSLQVSSGNVSVNKTSTGVYHVSIDNETYHLTDYSTNLTMIGSVGFIEANSVSGNLLVRTYDTSDTLTDEDFHFVVYKP